MKKLILATILAVSISSCTDQDAFENGKQQLESMGYTDVQNTGYEAWCCGKGDDFSTGFSARTSKGDRVTGCFCSGWGKGTTVRFN